MVDKNHRPNNQRYTRWSIRRLSVGVASVVVASGFFIFISNPVNAQVGTQNKVVTTTPSNSPTESSKSITDSKVGQIEKPSTEKKETPDTTKSSQELAGKTGQAVDKKIQEKQEVTKENKVGKTIAEAAKGIQKVAEKVAKEAAPKEEKDSSLEQVKKSVSDNIKGQINVPASYLDNAIYPGPFTAGVNQVIPYELFGGDGMLTRLLLKSSDGAPWSDNGVAGNAGLLPFAGLANGKYFYQVSLGGNAAGKQNKELLDQLKANGTQSYTATVTVYGSKNGKADLTNIVATRQVTINLNSLKAKADPSLEQAKKSVSENIKDSTDVPASFLQNANHPGPFTAGVNEVIPYEAFGGDGMLTRLLLKSSDGAPWSDNGTAKHAGLLPFAGIPKGKYFYQMSLDGNAAGKQGKALLDQLKANGTHTYTATVTVYGATKDGKADLSNVIATRQVKLNLNGTTTADQIKKSVSENIKDKIDVPASYLKNAIFPGPFTAGVNQVIPYELFGGDGMLTRLLLKSSDGAPWSDNGTANHPGLLPLAGLGKGQYFYQVSLDGNAAGKQGKALLDQLKANGTHTYTATVTVYGATKDGKADLNNVIATRQVKLNLNGTTTADQIKKSVSENIKESTDVPAAFLQNANHPGPFTAGVNEVIPYEAFGGDGMLTRLLLKSSEGAPWSDNGTAKHPGLLPLAGLGKGQYFYQVSLDGNAAGKQGKALLDQLKANGTRSYKATVTVYGATKDGKADLSNVIATRQVKLNLNGATTADQIKKSVSENIKDKIDVPASYLKNAVFPGPFTAGVNQVIPYELFGGDGMLTRLLLKSSNGAPWSDNGTAKHAGLLPLAGLGKGQYFYQVSLDGNAAGKQDKALLDQLKANGTHSYKATVTVYGAKDGKADVNNVIATKSVTINLKGEKKAEAKPEKSQPGQKGQTQDQGKKAEHDGSKHSNKGGTPSATTSKSGQAKASKKSLPNTGQKSSLGLTVLGLLGLSAAAILALVGMKRREKK